MKSLILGAVGAAFLISSCSTVYRTEQTPDDVYYSPAKVEQRAYVQSSDNKDDGYVSGNSSRDDGRRYQDDSYSGYDEYASPDDRWLMMRVRNPYRWSMFDYYGYSSPYNSFGYGGFGGYGYSPYSSFGYGGFYPGLSIGFSSGFYDPYMYGAYGFNSYYNWNTYYNPYYSHIIVVNPKTNPAGYTRVRNFNVNRYSNTNTVESMRGALRPNYNGYVSPNNRRFSNGTNSSNSTLGSSLRRVVSPNSSRPSYNQSYDRPVRTYTPSNNNNSYTPRSSGGSYNNSSSNSSSGGGSSSGGRPRR